MWYIQDRTKLSVYRMNRLRRIRIVYLREHIERYLGPLVRMGHPKTLENSCNKASIQISILNLRVDPSELKGDRDIEAFRRLVHFPTERRVTFATVAVTF